MRTFLALAALVLSPAVSDAMPMARGEAMFADGFEPICTTYYVDGDGDGHGVDGTGQFLCGPIPGYATTDGDCNDNDPHVHPGSFDFHNGIDDNCDGHADENSYCDGGLVLNDTDPAQAARAMDVCWGVTQARWARSDGVPNVGGSFWLGYGLLDGFGENAPPQQGERMLALSSGAARRPDQPNYSADLDKGYAVSQPGPEHPLGVAGCPTVSSTARDGIALELDLIPPPGATAFSLAFNYYVRDWPGFVCSQFSDRVLVMMAPPPPEEYHFAGNVLFTPEGNLLSELEVRACTCAGGPPCTTGGFTFQCSLGNSLLEGSGFAGRGATGWMRSESVPVVPEQPFTLRLLIYDSGDATSDSTILFDAFRWER